MDLRIQKTYLSLSSAFRKLLEEKPFEDITVSELCDQAMVRRATFYKHFGDKNEFFAFFVRQMREEMNAEMPVSEDAEDFSAFFLRVTRHIMDFMEDNEKIVGQILRSSMQLTMVEILSEELISNVSGKLRGDRKRGITYPASPNTMAAFYVGALMYTIRFWFLAENRPSKEALYHEIQGIIGSAERNSLLRPEH